jgi:hypothetical protein
MMKIAGSNPHHPVCASYPSFGKEGKTPESGAFPSFRRRGGCALNKIVAKHP